MSTPRCIVWSKRPSVSRNRLLGNRQRWRARGMPVYIDRFPESGSGLYLIVCSDAYGPRVIGNCKRLRAAQRKAESYLRERWLARRPRLEKDRKSRTVEARAVVEDGAVLFREDLR